jgi:hypothetical protein
MARTEWVDWFGRNMYVLSLNCNQSEPGFVIRGLNTEETPLQITWEVTCTQIKAANNTCVDGIFNNPATLCQHKLIFGYTSCLEIARGRQIILRN